MKTYEIFFSNGYIEPEIWNKILDEIATYLGILKKFSILIEIELNEIKYYIKTKHELPIKITDNSPYLLKEKEFELLPSKFYGLIIYDMKSNIIDMYNKSYTKKHLKLRNIKIDFIILGNKKRLTETNIYYETNIRKKILCSLPDKLLSIDFSVNSNFFYKKIPNYLNISKSLYLLKSDKTNSILKIDTFPYMKEEYYLNQNTYNFDKHSLIVGSSGTGKSKLMSLFINNVAQNSAYKAKYKIIVIDPHAALEKDVGGLENATIVDFKTNDDSVNLFQTNNEDLISKLENMLSLLKNLIADMYNSKLERVLRYCMYLLMTTNSFNFNNLKHLLIDINYRNALIKEAINIIPENVIEFFGNDFNELKTKSYSEAIGPIIAFIDEMSLLPAFYSEKMDSVKDRIENNFLTIFSLDQSKLGIKITKTIAGFLMNILMQLAQANTFDEHIILIVDEVSVVENPILNRLLSEARKYNISLILGQQYFSQITSFLKESIFANVVNYYIFRVSKDDASVLENNLNMKLNDDTRDNRIKLLLTLNDRECIVRLSSNGVLQSPIKAYTLDFISNPRQINATKFIEQIQCAELKNTFNFSLGDLSSLKDIMKSNSTSREGGF